MHNYMFLWVASCVCLRALIDGVDAISKAFSRADNTASSVTTARRIGLAQVPFFAV